MYYVEEIFDDENIIVKFVLTKYCEIVTSGLVCSGWVLGIFGFRCSNAAKRNVIIY